MVHPTPQTKLLSSTLFFLLFSLLFQIFYAIFLHLLFVRHRWPAVCGHMIQVLILQHGEALLFHIGEVVAGDEVETPRTELISIMKLNTEQQGYTYMREYNYRRMTWQTWCTQNTCACTVAAMPHGHAPHTCTQTIYESIFSKHFDLSRVI